MASGDRSVSRDEYRRRHSRRSVSPDRHAGSSRRHGDRDRDLDRDRERDRDRSRRDDHRGSRDQDDRRHHDRSRGERRDRAKGRSENERWEEKRSKRRNDRRGTPSDDDDLLDIRRMGIQAISEDDYFVKASEFKYWLKDSRDKDFHDMDSDSTRRYFRKFVRRWNDGALREKYYGGPQSSSPSTSRKRHSPLHDDRSPSPGPTPEFPSRSSFALPNIGPGPLSGPPKIGPTLPSHSDRQLAIEKQREAASIQLKLQKVHTRTKALERAEEAAPRLGGKEGKMAEKRAVNSANKEMREKEVGGLELDESTLMGEGSSFQAALRARDAAAARRKEKKEAEMINLRSANEERLAERRQKENETMQMLQAMAKHRFG